MEKRWLNLILFNNNELERGRGLSKAMDSLGRPIGNTSGSEDPILNDTDKNIHSWSNSDSYSCSNVDYFLGIGDIWNFISDKTFFVRDNNGNNYFVDFDMENQIFEIDNDSSFLSKLEISFSSSLRSKSHNRYDDCDMYDTQYSWNNHIKSCIEGYLCSEIRSDSDSDTQYSWSNHIKGWIDSDLCSEIGSDRDSDSDSDSSESISESDIDNDSDENIKGSLSNINYAFIHTDDYTDYSDKYSDESLSDSDSDSGKSINDSDIDNDSDENIKGSVSYINRTFIPADNYTNYSDKYSDESISDSDSDSSNRTDYSDKYSDESISDSDSDSSNRFKKFKHLWVVCENCYISNYKKILKSKMNICEYCGFHLKMNSSDRIELSVDPGTWNPMDEDMFSVDPIDFNSEEWEEGEEGEEGEGWEEGEEGEEGEEAEEGKEWEEVEEEEEVQGAEEAEEAEEWEEGKEVKEAEEGEEVEEETYLEKIKVSVDPIEFNSEEAEEAEEAEEGKEVKEAEEGKEVKEAEEGEEAEEVEEETYLEKINSNQRKTGLNEAVQTGIGKLNGIPIAMGFMDFEFIGGSMGSVVGEKITRLIEYATNRSLPLIIVCASGGARMQEGTLSLMQMAKISSALYDYQLKQKLFYISILTSPTTGGVTASFGMLGDIIIAEPTAYIAFAGKIIIEELLKVTVPEGVQEAEYSFHKGLLDSIVPRNPLKGVLSELFQLHGFFPSNQNSISIQ
uniref:acetyl-CoA carboxylase carboxyltransferase beta subunit n=1 Tax=Monoon laui TaxID=1310099 RepID=UPI001FA7FE2A|nr:acetyl-CoA carboxylase carboxyltransferase beta subunit [Monoon laui]ULM62336.1 acetyl-CoA carboxylase carboxyltransferase beta subunit [Monoon laui]